MRIQDLSEGCVRISDDDGHAIIAEPVVTCFVATGSNQHCVCGASIQQWEISAADCSELVCRSCHRTIAHFGIANLIHE